MNFILVPQKVGNLPEGMTHLTGTPCPFDNLHHPRGSTCCSLDPSSIHEVCRAYGGATHAELLNGDLNVAQVYGVATTLYAAYVHMLDFHGCYRERTISPKHPMMLVYRHARARGEEFPDGSFERFLEIVRPIVQVVDWLFLLRELRCGVQCVRSQSGRG